MLKCKRMQSRPEAIARLSISPHPTRSSAHGLTEQAVLARQPSVSTSAATSPLFHVDTYSWSGTDEYTEIGDRKHEEPLPLPCIQSHKRIVLVRHGQSTWNAEGRIQGSTNFAVLTEKGKAQAATTHEMLKGERFDKLFTSPLARAMETADIVWNGNVAPREILPSLREVDLYSFQGLLKAQGKDFFGDEYRMWQKKPAEFNIDGHFPIIELWYRASIIWDQVLLDPAVENCALVVAHNAVNQALVATAAGFKPDLFRRLLQSNAASTVLDFVPRVGGGPPVVTVDRLNQATSREWLVDAPGKPRMKRVILVRHAATLSSEEARLHLSSDEPCSALGEVQAMKTGEFLMDTTIDHLYVSPSDRTRFTGSAIAKCQSIGADRSPRIQVLDGLRNVDLGTFSGRLAQEVRPG